MEMTRREFAKDSLAYLLSAANRASGGYRSALGFLALPGGLFAPLLRFADSLWLGDISWRRY